MFCLLNPQNVILDGMTFNIEKIFGETIGTIIFLIYLTRNFTLHEGQNHEVPSPCSLNINPLTFWTGSYFFTQIPSICFYSVLVVIVTPSCVGIKVCSA